MSKNLENNICDIGQKLFGELKNTQDSFFDTKAWIGNIMDWVMKDQNFKIDLFRFVDVLPTLSTSKQVASHIEEYLIKNHRELPLMLATVLKTAASPITRSLATSVIKKNISSMAQNFILGSNIKNAQAKLEKLHQEGYLSTIDLLGEKTLSNQEADIYFERYKELIQNLPKISKNISLKISALCSNIKPEAPEYFINQAKKRVIPLLELAKSHGVFVNFDLENFLYSEITQELFSQIILDEKFKDYAGLGIVCQAYLKNSHDSLQKLTNIIKRRGTPITIRLVKGAYWDYEVVHAQQHGLPIPVYMCKSEADINFEKLSRILLDNHHILTPAFGSHNIRSLSHAIAYAESKNIAKQNYEIQMLYGMAEAERKVFLSWGHRVRLYIPVGEMLPGMSYLVRRLLENTSQMGFVKLSHHDHKDPEKLLAPPIVSQNFKKSQILQDYFENMGSLDFTYCENRQKFEQALVASFASFPAQVWPFFGATKQKSQNYFENPSPNNPHKNIIKIFETSPELAQKALIQAHNSQQVIKKLGLKTRAQHLENLARNLIKNRFELAAIICHEVGKTWSEADADICEAIDFCRYYAKQALADLVPKKIGLISGEHNTISYIPRGPAVIIAPWNFPLAILCGMSVAAYVAGNPIILKPAEQSSLIGLRLYQLMLQSGFLSECIYFLPGIGEKIGPVLVASKYTNIIAFTGSQKVGLQILESGSKLSHGQKHIKKIICELGGKNAIIVDDDADLDEAVSGIIYSAFGYAGQKCSAASRVIILDHIYDLFVSRLIEASESLIIANSCEPQVYMGPVIDKNSYLRLKEKISKLKQDSRLKILYTREIDKTGFFIAPTILQTQNLDHWVFHEELFGPILALCVAKNLEQAIEIANNSDFALTGAFYSRSPRNINFVKNNFNIGNLYINQSSTGALVGRQPFGGYKLSGAGTKAGGPNYILNFVNARVVTENTMRRGFTPEVSV